MRLPRPTSIRQRLLLISAAISLLTLVVAGAFFVINDVHTLRAEMVRDLEVLSCLNGNSVYFTSAGLSEWPSAACFH